MRRSRGFQGSFIGTFRIFNGRSYDFRGFLANLGDVSDCYMGFQ